MYVSYLNPNKTITKFYLSSKRVFKSVLAKVGRPGSRPCLLQARMVDRISDRRGVHVVHILGRPIPFCGRPIVSMLVSVRHS